MTHRGLEEQLLLIASDCFTVVKKLREGGTY